jgi:hypothetical protein
MAVWKWILFGETDQKKPTWQDLREQTRRPPLLFVTVTVLLQTRAVKHLDMIVHLLYSGLPAHLTRRENIFSKSHVIGNHFKVSRSVSLACTGVTLSPIVHKSKKVSRYYIFD